MSCVPNQTFCILKCKVDCTFIHNLNNIKQQLTNFDSVCLQASGASQQQDVSRKQTNAASLQLSASAVFLDSILAPGAQHVQALGLLEGLLRVSGCNVGSIHADMLSCCHEHKPLMIHVFRYNAFLS